MRTLLISILLASAAASPALAQDRGRWHHDQQQSDNSQNQEERQQAREARQQARAQARAERSNGQNNVQQPPQVQEVRRGGFDRPRLERVNTVPQQQVLEPTGEARRQSFDRGDRRERGGWGQRTGDLRQSDRPVPNVMRTRNPLVVSSTPREGTQPPLRTESRRRATTTWNTSWRHNDRYDWRRWRDRHRSTFHIGIYYDPFGWGYRPYQIGWRLWPSYYSSRYWINDPWQYRLPYAPPGYVWVRYWDDAILVDRWSGEVVDVIHNFFW
jgi:hypothetical protein